MTSSANNKPEAGGIACRLQDISKAFGTVQALDDVSLDIRKGEVLSIVGENGAGKSTLMNVLFGLVQPDQGTVEIGDFNGTFRNSSQAINRGLGMVHQHFMLYPNMTVLENVLIGAEGNTKFGFINFTPKRKQVQALIDDFDFGLDLDKSVDELAMDARQQLEIVKQLYRGAQIVILDEPTAVLIPQEVENLLSIIRKLAEEGKSVILVTHKLAEVMAISDRVMVMRGGKKVAAVTTAETDAEKLAGLMVGSAIEPLHKISHTRDELVLNVENLTIARPGQVPSVKDVSINLNAGEVLGVAGISGSGQKEFIEAIIGMRNISSGRVTLNGEELQDTTVKDRRASGMVYIAEDRMSVGLAIQGTVAENIIAGREEDEEFSGKTFLHFDRIQSFVEKLIARFDIKTTGPSQRTADLSGGNKQKIIVARELTGAPKLVIAENPSWGVDIGAISFIHKELLDTAEQGAAILLVSTELEELFALSDRIVVFFDGKLNGEFDRSELDAFEIGRAMSGSEAA